MPLAILDGTRIHHQMTGEGPDVVMVHGIAANMAFWFPRIARGLARSRRVTVYDLRGHGMSAMPSAGYTPAHMAGDLGRLMDHAGIARADLVGHSFGGTVCLEYAARHPERVRSLTLADVTVNALQSIDSGQDWAYWKTWRQQLESIGIKVPPETPRVTFGLLEELAEPRLEEARQKKHSGEFFVPFGRWNGARRTARRWLRLLRTTEAWKEMQSGGPTLDEIRGIEQPALLVFGERSRWLRTCHLLAQTLPNSETVIVPGAGHFFPLLKPQIFVAHLEAFLERAGKPVEATTAAGGRP
jgi:pimeloyl-ACP methyl ester carboxylesterase